MSAGGSRRVGGGILSLFVGGKRCAGDQEWGQCKEAIFKFKRDSQPHLTRSQSWRCRNFNDKCPGMKHDLAFQGYALSSTGHRVAAKHALRGERGEAVMQVGLVMSMAATSQTCKVYRARWPTATFIMFSQCQPEYLMRQWVHASFLFWMFTRMFI